MACGSGVWVDRQWLAFRDPVTVKKTRHDCGFWWFDCGFWRGVCGLTRPQKTTVKPQKTTVTVFSRFDCVFFCQFDLPCFSCSLDVTISAWVWCVVWYVWVCVVGEGGVAVLCVVSCRVVSCRVVSCRVVSCRVVSCRVVSCRVPVCTGTSSTCFIHVDVVLVHTGTC